VLLRVCFLPIDDARSLWDQCGVHVAIDELDRSAHDVLPLLHRRLVELDRRPPSLGRLAGIRRKHWAQNELRLRSAAAALDTLAACGSPGALVGGAGVLVRAHGSLDLRPLHDVDVVVAPGAATAAVAALARSGSHPSASWRDGYRRDVDATRVTDEHGRSIVVRWSASPAYEDLVDGATIVTASAGALRVADRADLLVHTLVDGARAMTGGRVRWVVDASTLVRDELDWDRVVAVAERRGASALVAAALAELDALVPLPAAARDRVPVASRRWWRRRAGR
jgi:hypothetical protein